MNEKELGKLEIQLMAAEQLLEKEKLQQVVQDDLDLDAAQDEYRRDPAQMSEQVQSFTGSTMFSYD